MERCTCGNVLRECDVEIRVHPCQCAKPGGAKLVRFKLALPHFMRDAVVKERLALGLPECTEYERAVGAGKV